MPLYGDVNMTGLDSVKETKTVFPPRFLAFPV